MIEVRIRKQMPPARGRPPFLLDVNFWAPAGITALYGPRGAGKTLTLDAVAGFLRPDAGRVLLDDRILFDADARVDLPPRLRRCPRLDPDATLFPHMTLRDNLAFAAADRPRLQRRRAVAAMLERLELYEAADRRPHEVSPPERRRAALGQALLASPRALLADELTAGLETGERAALGRLLREICAEFRGPILLAGSELEGCLELADHAVVIVQGKVLQSDAPAAVLEAPATVEVARLLGAYVVLPAEIRDLDPQNNTSRLRVGEFELRGPYFPARLRGDRVWLCVARQQLKATPRVAPPAVNQIVATLLRAVPTARGVRLEFNDDLAVEMDRTEFEKNKHNKEWLIAFPPEALRVL